MDMDTDTFSYRILIHVDSLRVTITDPEMNINAVYQSTGSELRESESLPDLESREISSTANMQKPSEVAPRQIMRGHTKSVQGVVPLPGGQLRVITCSFDGSLRLWDLESGAQIGNDWRDYGVEGDTIAGVMTIALSPDGKTVASGSQDGTTRLWDIETGKVITTRAKHLESVGSMCWSPDGEELVSGFRDGMADQWLVRRSDDQRWSTGHSSVYAVSYSPDATMIATSGYDKKEGIKIWNVNRSNFIRRLDRRWTRLLTTIEHELMVRSLVWTSDGKKFISGGIGSIRIFDTDTWQQIAALDVHAVYSLTLSTNDCLLASTSWDGTARLWDLDTNLQVGPPLQHENIVRCAAFSTDGKLLSTACDDGNAYVWDVHAIPLKEAGHEDLPINTAAKDKLKQKVYASSHGASSTRRNSHSSIDDKSFLQADATGQLGDASELPLGFFHDIRGDDRQYDSSGTRDDHHRPSAFLARLFLLLHHSRPNNDDAELQQRSQQPLLNRLSSFFHSLPNTDGTTELPEPPTPSQLHPRVLLGRLSSLLHSPPNTLDETTEPDQSSMPVGLRSRALIGRLSSFLRPQPNASITTQPETPMPSDSLPDTLLGRLSSLFRSPPDANEAIELRQWSRPPVSSQHCSPRVVEVSAMRDREVLYVARRPETASEKAKRIKNPKLWVRVVLFLCCVSPGTDNAQPSK
ncbi:hypothetical protein CY34DRAFT_805894 [Suillus luteus UH-Slu-Lm8-n1]|uniref:Unplaced genomic scaffold CY34scaffold_133, whole genome shotgun sequence n=1 Tax=Suillus luteus UH-Slu-Lm8-n1 TaxID=930992 RepID=A0A0D0B526_9AGAM|nr:hypothetical protein CY34DRAFT_805894 [Suillus luteus UH-Slu-Lm8-n1]